MLSTNDQRASVLAGLLRKQKIPAAQVCVGDLVVHDFGVYEVASIEHDSDGIGLLDEDQNGTCYPPGQVVLIIDRSCLDRGV